MSEKLEAVPGCVFRAKLVKPYNRKSKQRNIIYFKNFKQLLDFTRSYRNRFSRRRRVTQMHMLFNMGGCYLQDQFCNEYYLLRILF